jgi:hypothetical protein
LGVELEKIDVSASAPPYPGKNPNETSQKSTKSSDEGLLSADQYSIYRKY